MKNNPPKNPFSESTRALFLFKEICFKCGRGQNVEGDHITGRGSNSPYNLCPLDRGCHSIKTSKDIGWQLRMVKEFLDDEGYKPSKKDLEFLEKHKSYYK